MRSASSIAAATLFVVNVELFAQQVVNPQTDLSRLTPKVDKFSIVIFHEVPLDEVMQSMASSSGIQIRLAPDVDASRSMTFRLRTVNFENVFTFIVTAAKLDYTIVDEKTVLVTNKP